VLEGVYRAVAWQRVDQIRYNTNAKKTKQHICVVSVNVGYFVFRAKSLENP
jgi:hypothetical protein